MLSGCGGSGPARAIQLDPAASAAKALEAYDTNGDGQLSVGELERTPALAASAQRIDRDGDGALSDQEIRARLEALEAQSDFIALSVLVTSKGRPLVGAVLTLTPEPFMGDDLQSFSGTTVEGGACPLLSDRAPVPGIPVGFYQAKIVHAGASIDEIRGCEIADDVTGNRLRFDL